MGFIIVFIIGTFAVPLSFEIYKRGNDNVITRAGAEFLQKKSAQAVIGRYTVLKAHTTNLASGMIAFLIGGFVLIFILWLLWRVLQLFARLILNL